jgi:hypothetical protein
MHSNDWRRTKDGIMHNGFHSVTFNMCYRVHQHETEMGMRMAGVEGLFEGSSSILCALRTPAACGCKVRFGRAVTDSE